MEKDKKNIDYWDKYYGSGKDKKNPYPGNDKKYDPKTIRENQTKKSSGREYPESGGRIIGSEYKVKQNIKRRKRSPALRFTFLIVIVFLAGFFTFYAIDNHLFWGEKKSGDSESVLSKSESTSANNEESTSTAQTLASGTSQDNSASNTEGSSDTLIQDTDTNSNKSFWQALILFFKNFGKSDPETEDYPGRLNINVYFAILGNVEIFGSEERSILAGSPKIAAVNAINELLKGPYEDFNFAVIPAGTKLLGVDVANEIAKINFSQEFLSESLDSGILDEYIIYSIVNTLTEIPEIQAVSFSIDSKNIREYGNVDLRLPAIRNEKYLENKEN